MKLSKILYQKEYTFIHYILNLKLSSIPEQPIDTTYHKIINKGHRMKTKLNRKKNMAKGLLILCVKMKQQIKGGWQSNFSAHYLLSADFVLQFLLEQKQGHI